MGSYAAKGEWEGEMTLEGRGRAACDTRLPAWVCQRGAGGTPISPNGQLAGHPWEAASATTTAAAAVTSAAAATAAVAAAPVATASRLRTDRVQTTSLCQNCSLSALLFMDAAATRRERALPEARWLPASRATLDSPAPPPPSRNKKNHRQRPQRVRPPAPDHDHPRLQPRRNRLSRSAQPPPSDPCSGRSLLTASPCSAIPLPSRSRDPRRPLRGLPSRRAATVAVAPPELPPDGNQ